MHGVYHGLYVIGIYVEHGGKGNLGNICTIGTWAPIKVIGGKANLIIDHNMYGTACFIAVELCHLHHFVDNPLTGNGSIAMNEDGHYFSGIAFVVFILFCTCYTFHNSVYRFEMRRVGRYVHVYLIASICAAFWGPSQVILNVAIKYLFFIVFPVKLTENILRRLPKNIG